MVIDSDVTAAGYDRVKAMSDTETEVAAREVSVRRRFGPLRLGSDVLFQLWAPAATSVFLRVAGLQDIPLSRNDDGFWKGKCPVEDGARYSFVVDGQFVPDPASRFQPEDVHGQSQVIDSGAYHWRHPNWGGRLWEETVLYELHPGVFGGFNGIRSHLRRLQSIGITAIELMPIADFAGQRNWGYDGVLPFAPDSAYGTPDELRALVDDAHGLGLMVFLDVVYNHFGPDGNFIHSYAPQFFDTATQTPWGAAIEFSNPQVRRFFIENAIYWLEDFRFDGLRLDAVHAIKNRDWLVEAAAEVREHIPGRHIHLVLENENNDAGLLRNGFVAQWNDDFHNVLHVLLTDETHAYYADFAEDPAEKLARCLQDGFIYQGHPSSNHGGKPRGEPSGHLRPTSFVSFLQNHDQVGNRALGERLTTLAPEPATRAAMALLLLCPQIPMLFMGEESGATEPFLFFTDFHGELATQVREGRRREFATAPGFGEAVQLEGIPDPNHVDTFRASHLTSGGVSAAKWEDLVRRLLLIRRDRIVPFLAQARSGHSRKIGPRAVQASWPLGAGGVLTIAVNLADISVVPELPGGTPIFGERPQNGHVSAFTTLAWITP